MEQIKKIGVGCGVMILKDGKILLGRRHEDKDKADSELHGEGTWTMPGGKMHFGESFFAVAARETEEETGIKINKIKLVSVANDIKEDAHFITLGFLCEDFSGEAKVMEPDEITEWRWFALDNLPQPMFFPSQEIINNINAKIITTDL
jgi:8-oxo-dGTP diphosphatase